jgi:hypothetical protein
MYVWLLKLGRLKICATESLALESGLTEVEIAIAIEKRKRYRSNSGRIELRRR